MRYLSRPKEYKKLSYREMWGLIPFEDSLKGLLGLFKKSPPGEAVVVGFSTMRTFKFWMGLRARLHLIRSDRKIEISNYFNQNVDPRSPIFHCVLTQACKTLGEESRPIRVISQLIWLFL